MGFDITEIDGRRILWVDSARIGECLEEYTSGQFTALGINTARGYAADNIDFIREHRLVTGLYVVSGIVSLSLAPLRELQQLRTLVVSNKSSDFELADFPLLEEFRGYWHPRLLCEHPSLRLLDISNLQTKTSDLTSLPSLPALQHMCLVQGNLSSLKGIGQLGGLETLELCSMRRLRDLHDIDALVRLRNLICEQCRSLDAVEQLLPQVRALKVLRLNECSALASLRFLNGLTELEEFRFVATNVIDGDLTPLFRLKKVGFLRKAHFSHTPEQLDVAMARPRG